MQTILIGDIRGCSREFSALLDHVSPGRDDRLILLGDLVNKGPDPAGVVKIFDDAPCGAVAQGSKSRLAKIGRAGN